MARSRFGTESPYSATKRREMVFSQSYKQGTQAREEVNRYVKQSVYEQAAERDEGFCQDCDYKAAGEIHHIVRRGYWGKNAKHRGEVVENLICLCWLHHQGAHSKEAQRRHLTLLREKHDYLYDEQPWLGLLGEA